VICEKMLHDILLTLQYLHISIIAGGGGYAEGNNKDINQN
jgi:hypothetical protein